MIKDVDYWQKWENNFNRQKSPDFQKNMMVMEAMYEEAKAFTVTSSPDLLKGLEPLILYAKAINVRTASHSTQ